MSEENGEASANDTTTTTTTAHQGQYSLRNSRPSNDDTSMSEENGEASANDTTTTTTTAHQGQYSLRNSRPSNDDTSMSEENGEASANDTTTTTAHQGQYSLRNSRRSNNDTSMSEENGEALANDPTTTKTTTTAHQGQYSLRNSRPSNDDTSMSEENGEASANDTTTTTDNQGQYSLRNSRRSNNDTSTSEENGEASANDTTTTTTAHQEQHSLRLSLFDFFAPLECLFLLLSLGEDFFAIVNTADDFDERFVVLLFYIFGIGGGFIDLIEDDKHRLVKVAATSLFEVVQFVIFSLASGWAKMPVIVFACLVVVQNGIIVANAFILGNGGDEQGQGKKKSPSLEAVFDKLGIEYNPSRLVSVCSLILSSILGDLFMVTLVFTHREESPFRSVAFDFIVTFFLWMNPLSSSSLLFFGVLLRIVGPKLQADGVQAWTICSYCFEIQPLVFKMAVIISTLLMMALPTMAFWWHSNSPKPEPKSEFVVFIMYCVFCPGVYLVFIFLLFMAVWALIRSPFGKPITFTITGSPDGKSQPIENV